jgi:adenylate cyclase
VRAAVLQQRALAELRQAWRKAGREELYVRMGINTGMMVVGNMGSRDRMDYTMMGDAVNLAARLEGANKYYGSAILVSEYTYGFVKNNFLCRRLDTVRVQGKKEPIDLYEVVEEQTASRAPDRRFTGAFARALAAFHRMDFPRATRLFQMTERLRPEGDVACRLYLKRCAELIAAPPPDDWDKVYDLAK